MLFLILLILVPLGMFLLVVLMAISIQILFPWTRWALATMCHIHSLFTNWFKNVFDNSMKTCEYIDGKYIIPGSYEYYSRRMEDAPTSAEINYENPQWPDDTGGDIESVFWIRKR